MSASTTPFVARVLAIVRAIPEGRVASYGQIATLAGSPRAARAVGGVLKAHVGPTSDVPWQRVINAAGRISFKGDTGRAWLQRSLLEAEGVRFLDDAVVWEDAGWDGGGSPTFFDEQVPPGVVPPDFRDEGLGG